MAKKGSKSKKECKGGGGALLLSVALGAALAAGAGYYATHKEEVDREAKKKIDELAKLFHETKKQIEPKVMEVWGVVSKESVEKYMDIRGALLHSLEDERVKNAGELLKDNYETIVENVVKSARKSGILDAATEKKLNKLFKTDWKQVQAILATGSEVASTLAKRSAKEAGKAVKKAAKKVATKKKTTRKSTAKKPVKRTTKKSTKKTTRKTKK